MDDDYVRPDALNGGDDRDTSKPCLPCAVGEHGKCAEGACGCLTEHEQDDTIMRNFKRLKRAL